MEISREADAYEGRLTDLIHGTGQVIRRRWLTLAAIAAVIMVAGTVFIMMMTPQYQSTARIRIDPSRNPLPSSPQLDQASLNPEALETEVAAIGSIDLARNVVQRLKLQNDPEFTKGLTELPNAALSPADRETAVAQGLLRRLAVSREKLTYVIAIRFTSREAIKAANITNAFADAYLDTKVGTKVGTAERQSQWYQQRLDNLGKEVREADAAVAQYRAKAGITATDAAGLVGATVVDQQVAPLSSQLAISESEAAAAQANYTTAQQQIAKGNIDSVADVRTSAVIGNLRSQRAEILRSMGEVQSRYGEKHPESVRVRDQLASIDEQIKDEATRVAASLAAQARAAQASAASLRTSLHALEAARAGNSRALVVAQSLEREAAAKRAAYDRMAELSMDSSQAARNSIAQAVIIDRAQPPSGPNSPNKPLLLALVFVVALTAGVGTIGVQEMLATGMRTAADVESQLGIPLLAAIPQVPKQASPSTILLERPTSAFAESVRIARASIIGVKSTKPPKVIAFTSALPGEGKSTTSLAFARTLAINNARTLLLECDVRRASLQHMVKVTPADNGIVELLRDGVPFDEVVVAGEVPGLDYLLVKQPYFSSEDLFGNGVMERLLQSLRARYDFIILDLPPLVGLADGRFVSALADGTVLALKWNATPPQAAAAAVKNLRNDGVNLIGAVFTMVDQSAEAISGLYYSKKYSAYYQ